MFVSINCICALMKVCATFSDFSRMDQALQAVLLYFQTLVGSRIDTPLKYREPEMMSSANIYLSHNSALHFWRTNPPQYVLEGADRNIRALKDCPVSAEQIHGFRLSEAEFGPKPYDAMVPADGPRPRAELNYHVQKARIPAHSLYPVRDGVHVASPTLCFVQLCKSKPFIEALELGMEFCGTYALRPDALEDKSSRSYRLMNTASLRRRLKSWKDIHGLRQARRIAPHLANGSASPMETKVFLLLCLPQKFGGYNIEKPELNVDIELPVEHKLILKQDKVRPDMLWRSRKLILEYDGEYHDNPTQARRDEKRRAVLEMLGFTVIELKRQQVYDPVSFDAFATMIAKKCGKRIRPLTDKQAFAREQLRKGLLES